MKFSGAITADPVSSAPFFNLVSGHRPAKIRFFSSRPFNKFSLSVYFIFLFGRLGGLLRLRFHGYHIVSLPIFIYKPRQFEFVYENISIEHVINHKE